MQIIVNSTGGLAPLGYDIIDKKYVINEQEAIIVQKIFDWYINGKGIIEIATRLNSEGYKTKRGKPFGKNSLYDIISNERYTGVYLFNKGSKHNHDKPISDEIRIEGGIPTIISKEMYKKAMEIRQRNKRSNFKRNSNTYILSGLVFCGKCGGRYNGSTSIHKKNGKEYRNGFYVCTNRNPLNKCDNHRVKQDELENFVVQNLINKILNGNSIEKIVDGIKLEYNKLKENSSSEKKHFEKQLKSIQDDMQNVINVITKTGNANLVKQLELLEAQEEDVKSKIEFYSNNKFDIASEKIESIFKSDIQQLSKGSKEEVKKVIQKYIKRITIYDDYFMVDYSFDTISREYNFSQIEKESNLRYQKIQF